MVDAILRCPKCHAGMMSARRDGVVLDQCGACRGVFLAEGELSRLIESAGPVAGAAAGSVTGPVASTLPSTVPAASPVPNGYSKPVYEGRHRRD
jgi:Zn-finger nucleic acid-binding protein